MGIHGIGFAGCQKAGDGTGGARHFILWLAVSAAVMLALPWLAVTFVECDAEMAACFLLFFAVNPVYATAVGVFAGKDMKHLWGLPFLPAALFLSGTWIFFEMGETAFVRYAVVYLILGVAAMIVRHCVNNGG